MVYPGVNLTDLQMSVGIFDRMYAADTLGNEWIEFSTT
jgi:hypothetical protein